MQLEALKHATGRYLKSFQDAFKDSFFRSIKLTGQNNTETLEDLVDNVMDCIVNRFEMLSQKPLVLFQVFKFNVWPINNIRLQSTYGNEEISDICKHFS